MAHRYPLASLLALCAANAVGCLPSSSNSGDGSDGNGAPGGARSTQVNPLQPIANGEGNPTAGSSPLGPGLLGSTADAGLPAKGDLDGGPQVVSVCGDGVVEGAEVCDSNPCCNEACSGPAMADIECREAKGTCDVAEVCDGQSVDCPADGFAPAGTECRASTQGCDPAESCDGSAQCPTDATTCESCAEDAVGSTLGAPVLAGSTTNDDEDFIASCGEGGADRVVAFEAQAAGEYHFDTFGSQLDTVLTVLSSCDAPQELGECSQDRTNTNEQSLVDVSLGAGQVVFVHLSGNNGETGSFELNITAKPPCADRNVGVALGLVSSGNTEGAQERLGRPQGCGSADSVEEVVEFRLPESGVYQFDVDGLPLDDATGADFDPVLSLFAAGTAGGDLFAAAQQLCSQPTTTALCNDDRDSAADDRNSTLTYTGEEGEQVLLAIGGYDGSVGPWELRISRL